MENVLSQAKEILARDNQQTNSLQGNPTEAFQSEIIPSKLGIPQAHEYSQAPYSLARNRRLQ